MYSNFDHHLNRVDVEKAIQTGEPGDHFAWNFYGKISFDRDRKIWREEVWQYNHLIATHEDTDLERLIDTINDLFGNQ